MSDEDRSGMPAAALRARLVDLASSSGGWPYYAGQPARISRRLGWGDYRLELAGPGGAKSVIRFASGWGAPNRPVTTSARETEAR